MNPLVSKSLSFAAALVFLTGAACAQEATDKAAPSGLSIELSAAQPVENACLLSFVARNPGETDINRAVYEVVLFNEKHLVHQLTLLDFQDLPAGKTRVRQFQFAGLDCPQISQVLFNGASTCEGADPAACVNGLTLSAQTDIKLLD